MFIVKIPGINGNTHGCERAGNAILKTLKEEIFSNEQGELIDVNKLDLEEIHLDNSNLQETNKLIYKNSFEIFQEKPKTIFLGGDQSISYSTTRAFFDFCEDSGKKPCLIIFDSNPNLMPLPAKELPTNKQWLRKLIDEGFPSKNILLVGIRNINLEEQKYLKEKNIKMISINALNENLIDACDTIMEFSSGKELYVSVDMGVVDPVFAPSTSSQELGGLTSRQLIYLIQRINKIKNLRAIDIVEINEIKDRKNNNLTIKLGAKILSELI